MLHKGEKQTLLHFQNKVRKDRDHKLRVQCRIYKHVTHIWHRRQQLLLPLGKYSCSINARGRNSFTVSRELKMIGTKSTHLTSRLQRCDPKMAKNTTSHASFGEIPLLQKSEKQKLLHFQNKVSKERDRKLRVQCRIYKHVTHKWHRRQRLLLTMGKDYCYIKARSRNSFTVRMELDTIETKSTSLTSRLQRCDPQRFQLPLWKYSCSIRARGRNSITFKIKLVKTETTSSEFNAEITNMSPTNGTGDNVSHFLW